MSTRCAVLQAILPLVANFDSSLCHHILIAGEWDGPEEVFLIDLEIDARLEEIVEKLSQSERDDADSDSLYAHADVDVRSQFDAVRKQVLDAKKFTPEKKQKIHDILESLAVVKWGYCGPLEQMSLCDAFGVTSTFGFDYEQENEKTAYDIEATSTDASASSVEEQAPESVADAQAKLTSVLVDAGQNVDEAIIAKLTGKAAVYFANIVENIHS